MYCRLCITVAALRLHAEQVEYLSLPGNTSWLICFVQFDLGHEGACEEGDVISDVTLPPWAASAHDFIRIHREVSRG